MTQEWVTVEDVPILDEHELRDEDGGVILKVDAAKLEVIASKNNARVKATGDQAPIVIGHTKDDDPESAQPEVVGYASKFRVKPLFNTGRKAIHCTFRFRKDKAHLANDYPRRSVELWLSDWKIDPISLLGATTPERDLGLLLLSKYRKGRLVRTLPLKYEKQMYPEDQDTPMGQDNGDASLVASFMQALQATDVWQFMQQQMQEAMNPAPMPGEMPMDGMEDPIPMDGEVPEDDGFDDGGDDEYEDEGDDEEEDDSDEDDEDEEDDDEEEPEKYSSVASGNNTFNPGIGSGKSKMSAIQNIKTGAILERVKLRNKQAAIKYARLEQQVAVQAEEINKLRYSRRLAEVEKDLVQLEAEGYNFDRATELEDAVTLDPKQYAKHLARIKQNYSRAPIGRLSFDTEDLRSSPGKVNGRSKADATKVINHATKKGISYEAALKELEGE